MIQYSVVISKPAQIEIQESLMWYDKKSNLAHQKLLTEIDNSIKGLTQNLFLHSVKYKNVRSVMLKRFPYSFYYIIKQAEIRIISFFHHRRKPVN